VPTSKQIEELADTLTVEEVGENWVGMPKPAGDLKARWTPEAARDLKSHHNIETIAEEMDVRREDEEPSQFLATSGRPRRWPRYAEDTALTWAEMMRRDLDRLTPVPTQPPSILPKVRPRPKKKVIKESAPPPEPKKPNTTPGLGKRKLDI
jgi:hypothetical protein